MFKAAEVRRRLAEVEANYLKSLVAEVGGSSGGSMPNPLKLKAAEVAEVPTHYTSGRAGPRSRDGSRSPPWMRKPDRIYRGQPYWRVGEKPYTRKDGSKTMLAEWRSYCAACGEPFLCLTPTAKSAFEPNRRCAEHKRPGVKAGGKRK